jgi:hypothetical protein
VDRLLLILIMDEQGIHLLQDLPAEVPGDV